MPPSTAYKQKEGILYDYRDGWKNTQTNKTPSH